MEVGLVHCGGGRGHGPSPGAWLQHQLERSHSKPVVGGAAVSTVLETRRVERTGWQGENRRNWCVNSTEGH